MGTITLLLHYHSHTESSAARPSNSGTRPGTYRHPERWLIPQDPDPLAPHPIAALHLGAIKLQVKVPQDLGQDEPHLGVGELAADTVAGTDAERLGYLTPVIGKGTPVLSPEPALREKFIRPVEVTAGSTCRVELECH